LRLIFDELVSLIIFLLLFVCFRLLYFPIEGPDVTSDSNTDLYEKTLACITLHGPSGCEELAEIWIDEEL